MQHFKEFGRQVSKLQSRTKSWEIPTFSAFSHVPEKQSPMDAATLAHTPPSPHLQCSTLVPALSPTVQHCIGWGKEGALLLIQASFGKQIMYGN